jgi:group I intron endonuclease
VFYTIYKTTNNLNGKIYIGKHQTNNLDDGYLGSGKLLIRAFKKYGKLQFSKDILFIFDNIDDMNAKETELVSAEFCEQTNNYNLARGGHGGWSYANSKKSPEDLKRISKLGNEKRNWLIENDVEFKKVLSERRSNLNKTMDQSKWRHDSFKGRKHTEATKLLISQKRRAQSQK